MRRFKVTELALLTAIVVFNVAVWTILVWITI